MPGIPHPAQTTNTQLYVWIPHGEAIFCGVFILFWLLIWLWITYFKSLDHDVYCWFCGGDKEKNLCFMGAKHLKKDDGDYHDHMVA